MLLVNYSFYGDLNVIICIIHIEVDNMNFHGNNLNMLNQYDNGMEFIYL